MKVRSGSSTSAHVRIGDGRIPSDAVDIISLLLAASRNPVECLTPEEKPEPEEINIPEPKHEPAGSKTGTGIKSFWDKFKTFVSNEGDDDDFIDDDE